MFVILLVGDANLAFPYSSKSTSISFLIFWSYIVHWIYGELVSLGWHVMASAIDPSIEGMIIECYFETVAEALHTGHSKMVAHKEGVTGASMLLASMSAMEDEAAKEAVVSLNLRPAQMEAD